MTKPDKYEKHHEIFYKQNVTHWLTKAHLYELVTKYGSHDHRLCPLSVLVSELTYDYSC